MRINLYIFPKDYREPLTLVVDDSEWNAFGPITRRSRALYNLLQLVGGINESVEPGTYQFNARRLGFRLETMLAPIDSED